MYADQTHALAGFTFLRTLVFACAPQTGECSLRRVLARSPDEGATVITADFSNVADLAVTDVGGGHTQLLYLTVEDISTSQRERIRYRVAERERNTIGFVCGRIRITAGVADGELDTVQGS